MSVLDGLRPEGIGAGPLPCYPSSRLTRPFVAMPDADVVVIFDSLRFAALEPARVAGGVLTHGQHIFPRGDSP